ncbi:hypothetical protein Taro_054425, partial [Colocasia esculenta]|nr:hypothetical protein [Colocasia esculenta]
MEEGNRSVLAQAVERFDAAHIGTLTAAASPVTSSIRECPGFRLSDAEQLPPTLQVLCIYGNSCEREQCSRHQHFQRLKHVQQHSYKQGGDCNLYLVFRNVHDANETTDFCSKICMEIHTLEIEWDCCTNGRFIVVDSVAEEVLGNLYHPLGEFWYKIRSLNKLVIRGYTGSRFASSFWDRRRLHSLYSVTLQQCSECEILPPLSQLSSLKELFVEGPSSLESFTQDYDISEQGWQKTQTRIAFPSLQKLEFHNMPFWKEWLGTKEGDFPLLRKLVLKHCPKLRALPHLPPRLKELELEACAELASLSIFDFPDNAKSFISLKSLRRQLSLSATKGTPPILRHICDTISRIHVKARWLTRMLAWVRATLDDAEDMDITEESIRDWLRDLQEVADAAEDLLDEFPHEALRLGFVGDGGWTAGSITELPRQRKRTSEMAMLHDQRMEEIVSRFMKIKKPEQALKLDYRKEQMDAESIYASRTTSSVIEEPHIVGRDKDLAKIKQFLLSSDTEEPIGSDDMDDHVFVMAIVGMGGLGKTTLAQLAYSDSQVNQHFELKSWVCVSEDFDVIRLTKAMLQSLNVEASGLSELDPLQRKLLQKLKGQGRLLLVLDDVWEADNLNIHSWNLLTVPLRYSSADTKIIMTTRSRKVSEMVSRNSTYDLAFLPDEDTLKLFMLHAFEGRDPNLFQNLVVLGKEIARRCGGVPLATKTLGGLLRNKDDEEWNKILDSEVWNTTINQEDSIIPILWLSYRHLPAPLKRCFRYCSLFPKDFVFDRNQIICMWMAQGFIKAIRREFMEDVGERYIDNLLSRSFFQQHPSNPKSLQMHDLMHDLAICVSGDECYSIEGDKPCLIPSHVRHLSILPTSDFRAIIPAVEYIGSEFFSGGFPQLEELTLREMGNWKSWCGAQEGECPKLKKFFIDGCVNLESLPPLGQLPSLRVLSISEASAVKNIGSEFFSGGFPQLEELTLSRMDNWKSWCSAQEGDCPKLKNLSIDSCPNLESLSLINLGVVEIISISGCPKLRCMPGHSLEVSHLQHAKTIKIQNICEVWCIEAAHLSTAAPVEDQPPCLQLEAVGRREAEYILGTWYHISQLTVKRCSKLMSLPFGFSHLIRQLTITECANLTSLPWTDLITLEYLMISECPLFQLLDPEQLPPTLQVLCIYGNPYETGQCSRHQHFQRLKQVQQYSNKEGGERNLYLVFHNVHDASAAVKFCSMGETKIHTLEIEWDCCTNDESNDIVAVMQEIVFKLCSRYISSKKLVIRGYTGSGFAGCYADFFSKELCSDFLHSRLSCVSLFQCPKCEILPALNQLPFLEELHVGGANNLEIIVP